MVKFSKLRSAPDTHQGRWFDYVPGVRLLIAKWGNPRHMEAMERIAMRRAECGQRELSKEDLDHDEKQAAAEGVLLGWEGLDDDAAEGPDLVPIPYSTAQALRWFLDPDFWEFWQSVKRMSAVGFRAEKAIEGN